MEQDSFTLKKSIVKTFLLPKSKQKKEEVKDKREGETEEGKEIKRYYHKLLEAKLVLAPNLVLCLDTEFIENENKEVSKQDCETNAAKRLLERLKKDYPRLPIVLQGDALYAILCHCNYTFFVALFCF